jgi:CelD/BcsL family acetyltransferase involved in cellulose biosynthesis
VHIEVIDTLASFNRLEENWNTIYDQDPDAQFFLSFRWLAVWLSQVPSPWIILAAKESGSAKTPYLAFLPLRVRFKAQEGRFHNELNMVGNFAADYTGILSVPAVEHRVIPAFARYIKQMNWARLNLDCIRISESRLRLLLAHFPKAHFQIDEIDRMNDNIDNNRCPFAQLPGDWDAYLATLSANTRQKIRRLLRLLDTGDEYRITYATPETIDRDLDALLRFWETKWKPRKGDRVHTLARSIRSMLTASFKADLLLLPTLWQADRPLASLAILIDRRKATFLFLLTGRDESFEGPPPGMMLHAHCIRYAIANGFKEYDFSRGNEPYKYSFGVKERRIRCVAVTTKNGLNLGGKLDRRTIPDALREATELQRNGRPAEAERCYRLILDVEPRNADAIHRLGELLTTRENHVEAKRLFKILTTIRPELYKPRLCLARSCEALGQYREAADSYRAVIKLAPEVPDAFTGIGRALLKLGRTREFEIALDEAFLTEEPSDRCGRELKARGMVEHRSPSQPVVG